MKKGLFTLAASMVLTVAAAASPDPTKKVEQNDPKKQEEKKASFGLTEGYFSIFDIFKTVDKVDTLRANVPAPLNKRSATPKK
jgi:hypothetical protein